MKKRASDRLAALILVLAVAFSLCPLAVSAGAASAGQAALSAASDPVAGLPDAFDPDSDSETLYIQTVDDLLALAECCTLDTWSQGKTVVLQADLSLEDSGFVTIPSFGGFFDGGGHTVSGLQITQSVTPAGLFAVVQKGAVIKDLNVSGAVVPDGDGTSVGGIAGENSGVLFNCSFAGSVEGGTQVGGVAGANALTGQVLSCSVNGSVIGSKMTGGIAGCNLGLVSGCENDAYVNTVSVDPTINPTEIDLSFSMDFSKLSTMDTSMTSSDTGGIAGYSSGILARCVNRAPVGYPHIGYNVGGVAGRSCGYMYVCENEAAVYGRKDIGGITGQMEPYIAQNISETTLVRLERQMTELDRLVTRASKHADAGSGTVRTRLNAISGYLQSAADAAGDIHISGSVSRPDGDDTTITLPEINAGELPEAGSGDLPQTDIDDLDIPSQIEVTTSMADLSAAIGGIAGQMKLLSSDLAGTSGTLNSDLKAIQKQINAISDTAIELFSSSEGEGDILVDSSETDPDAITLGKVYGCTNSGRVDGDINVGGIAGAMAMEYELDPEDDVSSNLDLGQRRKLEVKAVVQQCCNRGTVEVKRNYAGGICGRMDLGLIVRAENYGTVTSESGEYVGGIAGLVSSTVRSSFAKCMLSGKKNVGGIVGSGTGQDASGESSTVAGCYSMVSIEDCTELYGAVSGAERGSFVENYFVSDTLTGINGRSYTGRAEPLTYDELAVRAGTAEPQEGKNAAAGTLDAPEEFLQLYLTFVVDGETIKTVPFEYGASFDRSVYPDLPDKDGYYVHWDKDELSDLHLDTVVTAVYTPYVTALANGEKRTDGRPIFFVQGEFDDEAAAEATALPNTPEDFKQLVSSEKDFFGKCFTEKTVSREIVEEWRLTIPEDGKLVHTVRYLAPDGDPENMDVYVKRAGKWNKVDAAAVGSYLEFSVEGNEAEIAVISTMNAWWVWALTAVLLAILVQLAARLIHRIRRKRQLRAALAKENEADTPDDPESGPDNDDPEMPAHAATQKKKRWVLPLALVLAVAAACGTAVYFLLPKLLPGVQAYRLLKKCAEQQELTMALTVDAELGGQTVDFEALLDRTEVEGQSVTAIRQEEWTLYYCGETIFLQNGRAYRLNAAFPDYSQLLGQAMELYRRVELSEQDGVYTLTAGQEDAKALLELLLPSMSEYLTQTDSLQVQLVAADGQASELRFSGSGTLNDEVKTDFKVSAVLRLNPSGQERIAIPEAVRHAISAGDYEAEQLLSEELVSLVNAWQALEQTDPLEASLRLTADCGPLTVREDLTFLRWNSEQTPIYALQKNNYMLYFTDTAICDRNGRGVALEDAPTVEAAKLMEIAYQLCMNAQLQRSGSGSSVVYTLGLDEAGMEAVTYAIAPAARNLDLTLDGGTLRLVLRNGRLYSLDFGCGGTVRVALTDAAVSFGAQMEFAQTASEAQLPAAIQDALN